MERKVIRRKKWKRKKRPAAAAVLPPPTVLQRLYLSCRKIFKGGPSGSVPFPAHVQELCAILNCMTPEDVGLSRDLQFFNPNNNIGSGVSGVSPRVTYTTIYQCKNFSLCMFLLPANAVIPLHNHPQMTVFTKLLLGTMHIKSYDWVLDETENHSISSRGRLAKLKDNSVFNAPCDSKVLYPNSGGNIHEFRAITPCLVLDVLGPPYSKMDGRDSSYYTDIINNLKDEKSAEDDTMILMMMKGQEGNVDDDHGELIKKYGWLKEIEPPKDSVMDVTEYLGPQVIDQAPLCTNKRKNRKNILSYS